MLFDVFIRIVTVDRFQVTPAIRDYVNDKIGSALSKVGRRVSKCDVHIIFDKNPSVANPAHAEVYFFGNFKCMKHRIDGLNSVLF